MADTKLEFIGAYAMNHRASTAMARMTIRTAWESAGVAVGQNTRTGGAGVIRIGKLGIQADGVGVGQKRVDGSNDARAQAHQPDQSGGCWSDRLISSQSFSRVSQIPHTRRT